MNHIEDNTKKSPVWKVALPHFTIVLVALSLLPTTLQYMIEDHVDQYLETLFVTRLIY
jgi:hypothetical protein